MKEPNPKLIGMFVTGGVTLIVTALILFSSNDLFAQKRFFVAYFQQSVQGLNIGAAVRFRGIPIGKVTHIDGIYDPDTGNMIPRLTLEVRPETLVNAVLEEDEYNLFQLLLKNGMRASLKAESLLTGHLYVSLDFHPDKPVRFLGTGDEDYPEMPTIDSGLDAALAKLSHLPIEELITRAAAAMAATEDLLRDPNIRAALDSLALLLQHTDETVVDVNALVQNNLGNTLTEIDQTLISARASISTLTERVADGSLKQADAMMHELEQSLILLQVRMSRDDPLNHELLAVLRQIAAAAKSISALTDYLEEHPEALLKGKNAQ